MKHQVVCAGHICLDIVPIFDDHRQFRNIGDILEPGKLINMHGVNVQTGGSVANTGLALKKLGHDVRLMGKVGNDAFGNMIHALLAEHGAGGLITENGGVTSYSVVLAVPGIDRIFLHDPGTNNSFSEEDIPWSEIEGAALFHFGYPPLMKRMYADEGRMLHSIFRRVKENGTATSLDLAAVDPQSEAGQVDWELILEKTLPEVDFFEPSFEELCWMLDRETYHLLEKQEGDLTESLDLDRYARPLAERCIEMGCGAVLIKCGISGMYYKTASRSRIIQTGAAICLDAEKWADREGIQPCFKADRVLSASGAGDVSIAAFLSAVLSGEPPERCAALAAAEGAASVAAYDILSGILPLDVLSQRIDAGWKLRGDNV